MKPEDKELLLKDLCARLPYGVIVHCKGEYHKFHEVEEIDVRDEVVRYFEGMHLCEESIINCFPYLRPLSTMTEEEKLEFSLVPIYAFVHYNEIARMDWLNAHHFDYRGLIDRGLAIEVTEENNPYKD